ncbi:MAG: LysR family transcriptional regulator [Hungatella sp.]|nr:LysR family transcriptional regulator [Hungatella sp.]
MRQDMKYVYQVYEDGSFSKAAEHLYMTQPALSIAIQKIEESIGMPLFDRNRRPLKPTSAGQLYIDMIKKVESLERDLDRQIHDIQNLNTGEIRLGGSHYLNAYILPKVLTGFSRDYPGVRLEVIEESSDVLADMLTEQKLDLTFSCNTAFMRNFQRYSIFYDHILLAVHRDDPVNRKVSSMALTAGDILNQRHLKPDCPATSLKSFCGLEYILLTKGNNLHDRALALFEKAGFEPRIKLMLSQLATAYHLAEENYAATFISDRMVKSPDSALFFYKLDSELSKRLFYVLLPDRNYTSHAVKMFIQYLLLQV